MLHRKLHKKCFLEQKGMTCNHTLRSRESFQPLYGFRPITSIHHSMGSVRSAPPNPYFVIPDVIES